MDTIHVLGIGAFSLISDGMASIAWEIVFMMNTRPDEMADRASKDRDGDPHRHQQHRHQVPIHYSPL